MRFAAGSACARTPRSLYDPEIEDLAILTKEFGLHPLAVEDAVHDHERPRFDRYPDNLFVSAYQCSWAMGLGS